MEVLFLFSALWAYQNREMEGLMFFYCRDRAPMVIDFSFSYSHPTTLFSFVRKQQYFKSLSYYV